MSLREQIMADIKTAMKSKETEKLETLRFLNSAIKNKEIEVRPNALTEDDVMAVLKKAVKQRNESIEQFRAAGREDLASKEEFELKVLQAYLPAQMSPEKLEAIVVEVISATGANSVKQMGLVMKEVVARTQGAADNKAISEIVKAKLN